MASRKPRDRAPSTNTTQTHQKGQSRDGIVYNAYRQHRQKSPYKESTPESDPNTWDPHQWQMVQSNKLPQSRRSSQSNQPPSGNDPYCEVCRNCASQHLFIATDTRCQRHGLPVKVVTSHQCPSNVSSQPQFLAPPPRQDENAPSASYANARALEQGQNPYPQASRPNPSAASTNASRSHASSSNVSGHMCDACGRRFSR